MKIFSVFFVIFVSLTSYSQSINLLQDNITKPTSTKAGEGNNDTDTTNKSIAFPFGANGNVSDSESTGSARLGVQVAETNDYFLSIMYSFGGRDKISGANKDFGAYLLNPQGNGQSFIATGNKLRLAKSGHYYYGLGINTSINFTEWESNIVSDSETSSNTSYNGLIFGVSPSYLLMSKSFKPSSLKGNSYQLGLELGPTARIIGGDLAHEKEFLQSESVLNNKNRIYIGGQVILFARLNSSQPYISITYFKTENYISEFSGIQAYMGFNVLVPVFSSELSDN